jgi:hypothetical protein
MEKKKKGEVKKDIGTLVSNMTAQRMPVLFMAVLRLSRVSW